MTSNDGTGDSSRKLLLVHDGLTTPGGGERVIYHLSKQFDCDIVAGEYRPESTFDFSHTDVLELGGNTFWEFTKVRSRIDWSNYDAAIFSGNRPQFTLWRQVEIPTVRYCHSPTRIFWSLRDRCYRESSTPGKLFRHTVAPTYRTLDRRLASRFDKILTNSHNIRSQVERYYGLDADVVYPPIDTDKYHYEKSGDFWLSVNRLVPKKRVQEQIDAFNGTDEHLRIVGGIDDQFAKYGEKVRRKANESGNISIEGSVSDEALRGLYARCKGVIYIPHFEDFGIVPVESMASGKPVVAAAEGGPIETIEHGRTGWLVDPTVENVREAITRQFSPENLRDESQEQAKSFDSSKFNSRLESHLSSVTSDSV